MKTAVRVWIGILVMVLLCTGSAWAKKDKKGGGPQIPPVITADQAKSTVSTAIPKLSVGKPFTKQGKQGDIKFEVPLSLEGKIVAKVRLNPATGEILTKGQKGFVQKLSVTPEQAVKAVQGVVNEAQVGAAWLGKQGEWKVPLLYKGAIVAEINVHGQDGSILPDWKASKDATMFGK
ncbi:MAG: hypothetical protein FJ135_15280 [Deltaproteobacteria bacterium]|nr:hypothetical protein [Deltaproteobacteria bacterium]